MSFDCNASVLALTLPKMCLSAFRNRGRTCILVDILNTLKEKPDGKTKTQIMQSARLNYKQVTKFINLLLLCDLIRAEPFNHGKRKLTSYALTKHGSEFLESLQKLQFAMLFEYKAL